MIVNGERATLGAELAKLGAAIRGYQGINDEYWVAPLDQARRKRNQRIGKIVAKITTWVLATCLLSLVFVSTLIPKYGWPIVLMEILVSPELIRLVIFMELAKEQERGGRNLLGLRNYEGRTLPPEEAECEGWPTSVDDKIEPGGVLVVSCHRIRLT